MDAVGVTAALRDCHAVRDLRVNGSKKSIVRFKGYENKVLTGESVAEISYQPNKCSRFYRLIILRKNISVKKGEQALFDNERYFFYITNHVDYTPHRTEFRRFLHSIILLPTQIVRTGRRVIYRIMNYDVWLKELFAAWEHLRRLHIT